MRTHSKTIVVALVAALGVGAWMFASRGILAGVVGLLGGRTAQLPPGSAQPAGTAGPAPAPVTSHRLVDGTYTGHRVYVYYGYIDLQAQVKNGHLAGVQVTEYPSDNGRSRYINGVALPYLVQEAVQAQSANISLISGATLTSEGFAQSLQSALQQAGAA
jgi:uncharacterized protein with FMN-binding domain